MILSSYMDVSINKLQRLNVLGDMRIWYASDIISANLYATIVSSYGMPIKSIMNIDSKSENVLVQDILEDIPDAKLIIIELTYFPHIHCRIDKPELLKNDNDNFSKDILAQIDSKEPGIPVIIVNANVPFTGIKHIVPKD